jgi:hypothetical protein
MTAIFAVVLFFSPVFSAVKAAITASPDITIRKFDEFADTTCEDEYAHLDNFVIALQNEPQSQGVIVFYGGTMVHGKLPRQGEAEARAARLKPYLVERRGISSDRIVVINGGFMDKWKAELWIRAPAARDVLPLNTATKQRIKFRKGKVSQSSYRCNI